MSVVVCGTVMPSLSCQEAVLCLQNNERLLKLYESGLPVWAIFLPTYGLYYRPWMRRMTWILFIAVSVFSMACGFYDLYKNVPHVDKVSRTASCSHGLERLQVLGGTQCSRFSMFSSSPWVASPNSAASPASVSAHVAGQHIPG